MTFYSDAIHTLGFYHEKSTIWRSQGCCSPAILLCTYNCAPVDHTPKQPHHVRILDPRTHKALHQRILYYAIPYTYTVLKPRVLRVSGLLPVCVLVALADRVTVSVLKLAESLKATKDTASSGNVNVSHKLYVLVLGPTNSHQWHLYMYCLLKSFSPTDTPADLSSLSFDTLLPLGLTAGLAKKFLI